MLWGSSVGRIGLLECYKLLQLNQTATPDVDRQQQQQLRLSNECDRSDDILKALRTLRLSRSSLSALSLRQRDSALAQRRSQRVLTNTYTQPLVLTMKTQSGYNVFLQLQAKETS